MARIFSLANELLASIFKHLDGIELAIVARTCQRFHDASLIDQIWQHLCFRDYGVSSLEQWPLSSFRELYILVLHKYGCLIGVWKCQINPYGGLVHIKASPGKIEALECRAPFDPEITSPLRPKLMFTITVQDGEIVALCFSDWEVEPHRGKLSLEENEEGEVVQFSFKCDSESKHEIPTDREEGTYSSHGVELVMISFTDHKMIGTKITGDPNVPGGEVTFEVDLTKPLPDEAAADSGEPKRFSLPQGYEARYTDFPSHYKARFHSVGQIASHGFVSPQWTPAHFVLFNDDLFGFLWIELMAFSVYSRVTEPFLK
ncbi:F-box only protein 31-like isoform X2 [Porites lutea]|uniref:F-box only protein 31-like isoform X2 n=1 Tax=Porites lutea TaxID=51062 RepID=UPI003CC5532D